MNHLFVGQIVHTKSIKEFEIFTDGFVAVKDGKITKVGQHSELAAWQKTNPAFQTTATTLTNSQSLLPGFIDCHIHAPQMPNIGLGLDMELMDWLNEYTYPLEVHLADTELAQHVYEKVVKRTLCSGTTLATYFATNFKESSIVLVKEAIRQGQRAFVGKVSSNCNCPSYYVEETEQSMKDNIWFVDAVLALNNKLVQPIITPRYALGCDPTLMKFLSNLATTRKLNIQSHISESLTEVAATKAKYHMSYAQVYDSMGILTPKTILAHGIHLDDDELKLISKRGTSIAHCPTSNYGLKSGLCDVRRILQFGVRVGLATDVSGGCKSSILCTIKDALDVSASIAFVKHQIVKGMMKNAETLDTSYRQLNYKEALYLATLGGAEALQVDSVVGNFVEGKEFDALVVDVGVGAIDVFDIPGQNEKKSAEKKLLELVQKFVYVGDDRNVQIVFVQGRKVKGV